MSGLRLHLVVGLLALAVLVLTVFVPKDISSDKELQRVELGLPIPFIEQVPSYDLGVPLEYRFLSLKQHPTRILPGRFLASYLLLLLTLELVVWILRKFLRRDTN